MSESTSAPSAPSAPAPGADTGGPSSPAPSSQPSISVSEAGALLNRSRRLARAAAAPTNGAPPAPAAPARSPSPRDVAAAAKATTAAPPVAAPPAAKPPAPANDGLSALDRALAGPNGATPPVDSTPGATPPPTTPEAGGVEIDGRRYSTSELREFLNKGNDYTQKTQALATERAQLAEQQRALAAVIPYIQPELQKLAQTIGQPATRPDPALLETNPQQYLRELAAYETQAAEQNRLGTLTQMQQQAQERALAQQVAQAHETMVKEFPFWADPEERGKAQQAIVTWATTRGGWTRDQLHHLAEPNILKAMMKARAYDNLMDGAKTTAPVSSVNGAPVRGAPPPAPASERIQQAEQSFGAKPDVRNAVALLGARRARQG